MAQPSPTCPNCGSAMTIRKSTSRGRPSDKEKGTFVEVCSNTGCLANRDQRTRREG